MAEKCDFIRGWSKEHLFDLADLTGKTILDVGAGSGRLTFAAAEIAAWVYTSEPVGTLCEYMRDKIKQEGMRDVYCIYVECQLCTSNHDLTKINEPGY